MNVKTIVALFAVFCLLSCAPVGSGLKIEGNTLSCDHPRLSVKFKKDVSEVREERNDGRVILFAGDPRPLVIQFHRVPHSSKIDYFKSLREISSEMNFYYLGDTRFGEKEWAKIAKYDNDNSILLSGYFTNKDNEFIIIFIGTPVISQTDKDAFMKYKNTMKMPAEGHAVIDRQFAYFDEVAEIL